MKKIVTYLRRPLLIFIVLAMGLSVMPVFAEGEAAADTFKADFTRELRGTWIASVLNINFPSKTGLSASEQKKELDEIVKNCKEANLNAIFFQVRPSADALYDSGVFPTSKYLTGKQGDSFTGGFDPLKYIIEAAHKNGIQLHAWVNPFRITMGSQSAPEHDLTKLSKNHPARLNPSYVVKFGDGKAYFNPGLPEVQDLIVRGVTEIVKNYKVDGIHFDDYFYPYPANVTQNGKTVAAVFDDADAYKKYGKAYKTVDDFRRANVNKFVERCYKEIKALNPAVRFGISPFGIWSNKSANEEGSDTSGLDAYKSMYCDAASWVKGGYIDYICPQIYWSFGTKAAPYDVLVRWWSTLVDGTGVQLYIGHAAYKVATDFKNNYEIPRQVEYARSYFTSGSVFYGYKDLAANVYELKDKLAYLYREPYIIIPQPSNGAGVTIGRPADSTNVTESNINLMGKSDPAYPVMYDGRKITRTRSGYFSVYVPLAKGKNSIKLISSAGKSVTHTVYRGGKPSEDYKYPQMDSYKITMQSPTSDIVAFPKDKVQVRVQAPSGSTVAAKIGGLTVALTPLTMPPDEGKYMTEVYSGTITLPDTQPDKTLLELGNITFTAERGKERAELKGPKVSLINDSVYTACEVTKDYSHVKISPDSSFYDDYTPASLGMRDYVIGFKDKYYKLRMGGYIHMDNVTLTPERTLFENRILSAVTEQTDESVEIRIAATENVPVSAKCVDGVFRVTLYNTPSDAVPNMAMGKNYIFKTVKATFDKAAQTAIYSYDLIDADNFYGFEITYESSFVILRVRNPITKAEGDKPLAGRRIVVDAGHGGTDTGAIGFGGAVGGKNEKDLNLEIALLMRDKLKALGADVFMVREADTTVTLEERTVILNAQNPDLCISVHHNSMGDTSNNALTRGFLGLYCSDSGRLIAKCVSAAVASDLNRMERNVKYQSLAVMRNHKFPGMLAETLFLTNPDEYELAQRSSTVNRTAEAIVKGILNWFDRQAQFLK